MLTERFGRTLLGTKSSSLGAESTTLLVTSALLIATTLLVTTILLITSTMLVASVLLVSTFLLVSFTRLVVPVLLIATTRLVTTTRLVASARLITSASRLETSALLVASSLLEAFSGLEGPFAWLVAFFLCLSVLAVTWAECVPSVVTTCAIHWSLYARSGGTSCVVVRFSVCRAETFAVLGVALLGGEVLAPLLVVAFHFRFLCK